MGNNRGSFFARLFIAFFAGGCVPLVVLSFATSLMTRDILKGAYRARAEAAVDEAAGAARNLVSEATRIADRLASSSALIEYAASPRKDPVRILECNRLMTSAVGSTSFIPYAIAIDGTPPLCSGTPPEEYSVDRYGGWGLLGRLAGEGLGKGSVVFAQPHPSAAQRAPVAVGARIASGGRVVGYAIVDIAASAFRAAVGAPARASGALSSLCIADDSGCVAFDAMGARKESSFLEESADPAGDVAVVRGVVAGLIARGTFSTKAANEHSGMTVALTTAIAAASALISLAMAILLSRSISRPIHALTLTMKEVSTGRLDARCPEGAGGGRRDEIGELIASFNGMIRRIAELVESKLGRERELRRAEARALQAQINPHFLNNAINSIRSAARIQGADDIAAALGSLARILREGTHGGVGFCTVREGIAAARDYFSLESWRWPGRFELVESVDDAIMDASMPRLVIQPIVENALAHGLEPKPGKGTLRIEGRMEDGFVSIAVSDDGIGIERERLARIVAALDGSDEAAWRIPEGPEPRAQEDGAPAGSGIALLNTHRRLRLIYGPAGGLGVSSSAGAGTTVVIRFPAGPREAAVC